MSASNDRGSSGDASEITRGRRYVRAILIVALLLRIGAAILVERSVADADRSFLIEGDANGYWELGQKIAAGEDYALYTPPRQVLRVPGFPLLLSVSICLFGDSVLAARLLLAVIGTACCWLTYRLGKQLCSRGTGIWAALFVALNPMHVGNSILILSETWFSFWLLLCLLAVHRLFRQLPVSVSSASNNSETPLARILLKAATSGGLIGVTVLIRPGFLPWLPIVCAAVLGLRRSSGKTTATLGPRIWICTSLIIGCVLVLAPWAARNASVTGHWVWTSLWSGPSLYDGLNPSANGASDMQFFEEDNALARMSEFEMNEYYKQRAFAFARANPVQVVRLAFNKAARFLSPLPNFAKSAGWGVGAVCVATWLILVIASIFGLQSRHWDASGLLVMAGPLLLFLLVHMVFVGSVRYRLPLEFPLSVLGAIGWQHLWAKLGIQK